MFIYKITNIVNNKVYIGQTVQQNPRMRWYGHLGDARGGKTGHLYESIRKYGPEQFNWEIIDSAKTIDELNILEVNWIAHYKTIGEVYNHRKGGDNSLHSKESIEKMKASQKAAHARRRAANGGKEKHPAPRSHKGKTGVWKAEHPRKGTSGLWKMSNEAKIRLSIAATEREARKRLSKQGQQ